MRRKEEDEFVAQVWVTLNEIRTTAGNPKYQCPEGMGVDLRQDLKNDKRTLNKSDINILFEKREDIFWTLIDRYQTIENTPKEVQLRVLGDGHTHDVSAHDYVTKQWYRENIAARRDNYDFYDKKFEEAREGIDNSRQEILEYISCMEQLIRKLEERWTRKHPEELQQHKKDMELLHHSLRRDPLYKTRIVFVVFGPMLSFDQDLTRILALSPGSPCL